MIKACFFLFAFFLSRYSIINYYMKIKTFILITFQFIPLFFLFAGKPPSYADLIFLNGKIVTVDRHFTIAEAVAIKGDRIVAVGSNREIRKFAGSKTKMIDLAGKTVVPGLIDFHAHPDGAAVSELQQKIPDVHTVPELLNWIKSEAVIKEQGEWIIHPR